MLRNARQIGLLTLALGWSVSAIAQQAADPFAPAAEAAPSDPFLASGNPYEAPAAADPFSAAPAPGGAPADPFSASNAPPPAAADPFAAAPAPAAGTVADPFSGAPSSPGSDPFGAPPAAAPPASPDPFAPSFGGGSAVADPFAAAPAPPPGGDMPFGAPPPAGDNPFGSAAPAPATPDVASGSPMPSDPFGLAPAAATSSNPFALGDTPAADANSEGGGVAKLFQFRFMEARRADGIRTVVRKSMTREEAEAFDRTITDFYRDLGTRGELPGYQAGLDNLDDWVQWNAYAYQVQLWRKYCETIVLVGAEFDAESVNISFPGDATDGGTEAAAGGGAGFADDAGGGKDGGGARPQRPDNIYNENRSLDDQLADFNPLADTRPGSQGKVVFDPKQMDEQTKVTYNQYLEALRNYEAFQTKFVSDLLDQLDSRESARRSYQEWRGSQLDAVMEYVREWNRRYEGEVTVIAGVRYELYAPDNVPTQTVRGANIVVTDYDLTPYDILNEDGTLRGPSKQ
ncbi:hypothetical protein GC173_01270 [bacterium]|nr:hypothetical protein [bacterium]